VLKSGWASDFEARLAWPLVCAFVFSLPWEKSLVVPEFGTVTRLLGVLAFAAVGAAAAARRSLRGPNLVLVLAWGFALWEAITYFWSIAPALSAERAATFVQLGLMLWVIWESCRSNERQRTLLRAYVGGAAFASVLTIARYAQGLQTYYRRYAAPGFDPNDLALTVALAIPLGLYLNIRDRGAWRWLDRVAVMLAIVAILLTASRTALVVSVLAFVFVPWAWREASWAQRGWSVALFGLLVLGALFLAPQESRQRLASLPAEAASGTFHSRTQIWKAGLRVFRSHRLLGTGTGTYPEAVKPLIGVPAREGHQYVAHNSYLSVLVESGLVGLGLFGLWVAAMLAFVWFLPDLERVLWSVTLAVWALGITTLTWEFRKPGWLVVGLIMTEWARACRPAEKRG
jgi:O-antigen ligase